MIVGYPVSKSTLCSTYSMAFLRFELEFLFRVCSHEIDSNTVGVLNLIRSQTNFQGVLHPCVKRVLSDMKYGPKFYVDKFFEQTIVE